MRTVPVIVGPTAGGKSSLAMSLARTLTQRGLPAEIISADSVQVYRGLDIGSAKPSPEDRAQIPHHLIDIREPTDRFSVDQWLDLANDAVDDVRRRGGLPILVGGTHLYIKAFLEGLFEGPPPDPALRAELEREDSGVLRAELERIDPHAASRIHPRDRRRAIRAIEVHRQTGTPISTLQRQWDRSRREDARLIALMWPPEEINRRINMRVKRMFDDGLVEEARVIWESGRFGPQAAEALGYKQLIDHFEGAAALDDAFERIKIETRRFAKNQRTWLRRLLTPPRHPTSAPAPITCQRPGTNLDNFTEILSEQYLTN